MALTLAQSATLCQNKLKKGILEELVLECPLFRLLPFQEIVGNAYAYIREDTTNMGSIGFQNTGSLVAESTAQFTQVTASLYEMIGDADVPNLIQKSRSNLNDQMAAQVKIKTKLLGHGFEWQALYGTAAGTAGFDGLHTILASSAIAQRLTMTANATPAALSMTTLDQALDNIRTGKPDAIIMSRQCRRNITKYLRTVGSHVTKRDEYGYLWDVWGEDIPFVVCDKISDVETTASGTGQWEAETGGAGTSIFVVKFGDLGLQGLQNGGVETQVWDKLETKDASRTRIKWYAGMALHSTLSVVRICGISNAVAVA